MSLTREQVDELFERSKNDRAIIVGSEVRQLCVLARKSFNARDEALLDEIEEFLEVQQDVRDGEDGPRPNKAMSLLTALQAWRGTK